MNATRAEQINDTLIAYYKNACWEFGYASLCHMALPTALEGKTVIDIGCRRGKGVFKLSERVGDMGHVVGIDWVEEHIREAIERSDRASRDTGLASNNMEFHLAYPEDLGSAGIGDSAFDVAFINSILHLTCKPSDVIVELHRVLKPGGLLVLEIALADGPRDGAIVEEARKLGNSIQAAPCRKEFEGLLNMIGYDVEEAEEPRTVEPNMGFKHGYIVPTVPNDEAVTFKACVLHARKR
ncbi:MAG: class I SAM-dependent methyltransferase [Eggerthellaceae bacterium]|nr:class I SAM-dependent methyltransferase [Eggerthellaceae bacterium]